MTIFTLKNMELRNRSESSSALIIVENRFLQSLLLWVWLCFFEIGVLFLLVTYFTFIIIHAFHLLCGLLL